MSTDPEAAPAQQPEMTRERARTERRDLDKERGEPVAGGRAGAPRTLKRIGRPLGDWTTRPRILVTNDDGIESRGLLALKQALDPIGEVTVVAPDTNQSAVGHQKTLMRPLRVRERTLADGSMGYSIDGSPTDCRQPRVPRLLRGSGFDLVASGHQLRREPRRRHHVLRDGVSAAMEAVINSCPAFAISQEYVRARDFSLAAVAAAIVARNILEHGLKRGELLNVNVPACLDRGVRGRRGHPRRPTRLPGRADRAASIRAASRTTGSAGRRRRASASRARTSTRSSTGGSSVTPIHLDLTGRRLLRQLQGWDWALEGAPAEAADADAAGSGSGPVPSPVEQERIAEETQIERR